MKTMKPEYFAKLENYINEYQQKRGYSPSISDMVRDLEIPKTTVHRYLTHMKENGMLEINGRGKIATRDMAKTSRDTVRLPVLGAVSCGIPSMRKKTYRNMCRRLLPGLVQRISLPSVQTVNPCSMPV